MNMKPSIEKVVLPGCKLYTSISSVKQCQIKFNVVLISLCFYELDRRCGCCTDTHEGSASTQVLVTIGIGSLAAFLFGLRLRSVASSHLLALLLSCWAITFPLGLAVQWALPLPPLPQRAARLFPDSAILVEEQRRNSNRCFLACYHVEFGNETEAGFLSDRMLSQSAKHQSLAVLSFF